MTARGACPYCGGGRCSVLHAGMRDRLGLYPRAFNVIECMGCGAARVDRVPSAEELEGLYPAEYIIKDSGKRGLLMGLWTKAEMKLFYERAYKKDVSDFLRATGVGGGRILDVGCGNGGRLKAFSEKGFVAEGIETSRVDVDYVKDKLGLKARLGTLTALEIEQGSYSAITFFNVFEHLPDPAETAEKAFSLLAPGGWIAVSGPFMGSFQSRFFGRRWIELAEMPRHIYVPTTRGIQTLLERIGFRDCKRLPVSVSKLAHTMAESLVPGAIGSAAYRRGRLAAMALRAAGAAAMLISMPAALVEYFSGRASTQLFVARKPGGAAGGTK